MRDGHHDSMRARNKAISLVASLLTGPGLCQGVAPTPSTAAAGFLYIPPSLESRVLLYHSFADGPSTPEINRVGARVSTTSGEIDSGLTGPGLCVARSPKGNGLTIHSPALSPHRPLTVSMWWRLETDMVPETCFHLLTLRGSPGMVANFVRGKGQWCALQEPRYVFQVHYYEGIPNHNGIWYGNAWTDAGVWHHSAMIVSNAATVRVYWDGRLRSDYSIRGRPFREGDGGTLELGPTWLFHAMTMDEVLVLDRALTATEVSDYVTAVRRLHDIAAPTAAHPEEDR